MNQPTRANARTAALDALLECRKKEAFAQEILDHLFKQQRLSQADRRLTTQLVYGVLRRRGTLDALLRPLVNRPSAQVQPWLWESLRLGAFQLALLSQIPSHAAIFETVELAAVQGEPKAKTFINGVLRSVLRLLTKEYASRPGPDALPVSDGRFRRLAQAALPDPASHPTAYLAEAFSLPPWFVERWLARFGWEETLRLGFWFAGPVPTYLRVNPLKTDRMTLLGRLLEAEVEAEPGLHPQSIRLLEHASIRDLPGFEEGLFVVQDDSAMHVASALGPQPGWDVLDLCAGPGGKTTHLAELMLNRGSITACDIDEGRLQPLRDTCQRLDFTIIHPFLLDPNQKEPLPGPFDAVLVDVPCSNTGVLGRRPEARWRLKPSDLDHLTGLQFRLLNRAIEAVRPGGVVLYSTCSIEPEENRGVLEKVLKQHPGLVLEAENEKAPGRPADGAYWARLRKR